jgi:adenylate kinase family enzyme
MRERLLIFGASGSGTSTLGGQIAAIHGLTLFDVDDFFWEMTDPPFQQARERSERRRLLMEALSSERRWVLSGSICGWGDAAIPLFDLAVFVITPTALRLERLHARERRRFGDRLSANGDMHKQHEDFLAWAAQYDEGPISMRSRLLHEEWLNKLGCPVVRVDGSCPIEVLENQITVAMAI